MKNAVAKNRLAENQIALLNFFLHILEASFCILLSLHLNLVIELCEVQLSGSHACKDKFPSAHALDQIVAILWYRKRYSLTDRKNYTLTNPTTLMSNMS